MKPVTYDQARAQAKAGELTPEGALAALKAKRCVYCGIGRNYNPTRGRACCSTCWLFGCRKHPGKRCGACWAT